MYYNIITMVSEVVNFDIFDRVLRFISNKKGEKEVVFRSHVIKNEFSSDSELNLVVINK